MYNVITRHMIMATRKELHRCFQTLAPLNGQVKCVKSSAPVSEDMLRLWGTLQRKDSSTPHTRSRGLDTINTSRRGGKICDLFGTRSTADKDLLNRQPVYGDFMVSHVPTISKQTPTIIPIIVKKKTLQQLRKGRLQRNEGNLIRFLLPV
ncbi:uncharacterized protein LOC132565052 [Ylistrum balloti]|uniref:uncharacterized protein LOC132565052 n=1 Tax=Ylistrum balloti TaxID=509963 RepID=UPI002905CB23|nr:uncharacterized protein LOC132565052 [Ylistrum balloti]